MSTQAGVGIRITGQAGSSIIRELSVNILGQFATDLIAQSIPVVNILYDVYRVVDLITGGIFGNGNKSANKRNLKAAIDDLQAMTKKLGNKNLIGALGSFNAFTVHAMHSSSIRASLLTMGRDGVRSWNLIAGFLSLKSGHLMARVGREGEAGFELRLPPERVLILRQKDARFAVGENFITRQDLQVERDELHAQVLTNIQAAEADDVIRAAMPTTISPEAAELLRRLQNEEADASDVSEILSTMSSGPQIYEEIIQVLASQGEAYANIEAGSAELLNRIMGEPRARFQSLSRPGRSSPMDVGELINGLVDLIYYTDKANRKSGIIGYFRRSVTLLTFVLIARSGYVPETRETFQLAKADMEQILTEDFKLPFASVETTLSPLPISELPLGEVIGDQVRLPAEPKYASTVYVRPPSEAALVEASRATALSAMNRIRKIRGGFPGVMVRQDAIFWWYILLLAQSDPSIAKQIFIADTSFEMEECYDPLGTGSSQICQTVTYDQSPVMNKLGAPSLQTLFQFAYPDFYALFFPSGISYERFLSWLVDMSTWVNNDTEGFNTAGTEFNPAHLAMIIIMRARKSKSLPGVTGMLFSDAIRALFNKIEADALQADLNVIEMAAIQDQINIVTRELVNLENMALIEEGMLAAIGQLQGDLSQFSGEVGQLGAEIAWMETAIGENVRYQAWIDLVYEGFGMELPDGILSGLRGSELYGEARAALLAQGGV